MKGERIYEDVSPLLRRSQIVFILVEIVFAFLALFYWKIQILDRKKYWADVRSQPDARGSSAAPRAVMTDRNGTIILADNVGVVQGLRHP